MKYISQFIALICLTFGSLAIAQLRSLTPTLVPESFVERFYQNTEVQDPPPLSVENEDSLQVGDVIRNSLYNRVGAVTALVQEGIFIQFNDGSEEIYNIDDECLISRRNPLKPICVSDEIHVYHDLQTDPGGMPYKYFPAEVLGINNRTNKAIVRIISNSFSVGGVYIYDVNSLDKPYNRDDDTGI